MNSNTSGIYNHTRPNQNEYFYGPKNTNERKGNTIVVHTTSEEWRQLKDSGNNLSKDASIKPLQRNVAQIISTGADFQLKKSKKEEKVQFLVIVNTIVQTQSSLIESLKRANSELLNMLNSLTHDNIEDYKETLASLCKEWATTSKKISDMRQQLQSGIEVRIKHLEEKMVKFQKSEQAGIDTDNLRFLFRSLNLSAETISEIQKHNGEKQKKNEEELEKLKKALVEIEAAAKIIPELENANEILGSIIPDMISLNFTHKIMSESIEKFKGDLPNLNKTPIKSIVEIYIDPSDQIYKEIAPRTITVGREVIKAIKKFTPDALVKTTSQTNIQVDDEYEESFVFVDSVPVSTAPASAPPRASDTGNSLLISKKWAELLINIHKTKKEFDNIKISHRLVPVLSSLKEEFTSMDESLSEIRKGARLRTKHVANYNKLKAKFDEIYEQIIKSPESDVSLVEFFSTSEKKLKMPVKTEAIDKYLENTRTTLSDSYITEVLKGHYTSLEHSKDTLLKVVEQLWNECKSKTDDVILELDRSSYALLQTETQAESKSLDMTKQFTAETGFYKIYGKPKHKLGVETLINPFLHIPKSSSAQADTPADSPIVNSMVITDKK